MLDWSFYVCYTKSSYLPFRVCNSGMVYYSMIRLFFTEGKLLLTLFPPYELFMIKMFPVSDTFICFLPLWCVSEFNEAASYDIPLFLEMDSDGFTGPGDISYFLWFRYWLGPINLEGMTPTSVILAVDVLSEQIRCLPAIPMPLLDGSMSTLPSCDVFAEDLPWL